MTVGTVPLTVNTSVCIACFVTDDDGIPFFDYNPEAAYVHSFIYCVFKLFLFCLSL